MSTIYNEYAPEARPHIAAGARTWESNTQFTDNTFFMTRDTLVAYLRRRRHMK